MPRTHPSFTWLDQSRKCAAPLFTLIAVLAFATGGMGLAHRVLAHSDGGTHGSEHIHVDGDATCGSVPSPISEDVPVEHDADHGCEVCTMLATGVALPATPDAVSPPRPIAFRFFVSTARTPRVAPAPLPPARGPPSVSI